MNKDLTVGNSAKVLISFSLPLLGSVVFQQLYNIADSLVAGKFIGENALAAVGNSYEITLIFIAFAMGCNIGSSVIVAQLFGGQKLGKMKTAVYTTLIAGGVLCLALMAAGILLCPSLLQWIKTPENVLADSRLYLDIYILGLPFVFYYNIATGIFSALGDSKTPFIFLACSSVSNIAVDILFVTAFDMGVDGVAWATFLCQGVSCVLALVFLFRRLKKIRTTEKAAVFSWPILRRIASVAIPSILQQSFISVGNILIQGIINPFGSSVMAGYSASIKLNNLVITALSAISSGVSNFTAQNLGAGLMTRIREGFRSGLRMAWALCLPLTLIFLTAGKYLALLFLEDPGSSSMDVAVEILWILAPFYCVVASKLIADSILRGMGMMREFMIATFTDLILRVALAKILSGSLGTTGIWIAWPIGWVIASGLSIVFYKRRMQNLCSTIR